MLQELRITDLALIRTLELDFSDAPTGLIVFTGETGAGKSIILQAVHLLTGGRTAASLVRGGCGQAVIEASFDIGRQPEIAERLQEHGLDDGGGCILRRVVASSGRSRFFVNDRLATARLAAALGESLVDIASQHDQQQLLKSSCHLDFLDGYGELLELRALCAQTHASRQKLLHNLRRAKEQEQGKEQRRDFLGFQLREIRQAALRPREDEELLRERDLLKSSAALAELVGRSRQLLQDKVHEHLGSMRKSMEQAAALDPQLREAAERISSACFELEDLESCLSDYLESMPADQARMEAIASRLDQIRQLQRKYGATIEEVLAFADRIEQELTGLDCLEEEISALAKALAGVEAAFRRQADDLSLARSKAGAQLAQAMQAELASLSFRQALFEVPVLSDSAGLSASGQDKVDFLFSANPGEPLKPLVEVVSGGELSRLLLAMKCLFARQDKVETVILDEIDAGIGGEAAGAVARKIDELARRRQVFCITHLPQIAAHADAHFLVEKTTADSRTQTAIRRLSMPERAAELARMLGGDNPSEQTLALANELLERRKDAA